MNTLEEELKKLHELCIQRKLSIATAESCTGGFISKLITDQSNSSKYYRGSIIAYSNNVKSDILNISPDLINKYGAVSKEVSNAMAKGLLKIIDSDIALSVTGIMEKNDDTSTKDCQVYITVMTVNTELTSHFLLEGSRLNNRLSTVNYAFNCLSDFIHKNYLLS
jgi:nicotinamide-nucleotide amidase